ncbi:MAG: indolepyruvate oxidoreductase subunit beta [Candidatus Thermoplasmatota archaeon]|nr:indolepyruvate oxidoreductase subunit beta [Candidatus Thermoplasmatota archaeon]
MKTFNMIIAGVGGQGVITAGTLISEAAIKAGLNVVMSEIHGLSQRGGSVSVEVRIGDVYGPISPRRRVDLIMGFEPIETFRVLQSVNTDARVLMNKEKLTPISVSMKDEEYPDIQKMISMVSSSSKIYEIDAVDLGRKAGSFRSANVVMIGAALSLGILPVNEKNITDALIDRFTGKLLDINIGAMKLGMMEVSETDEKVQVSP